MTFSYSNPAPKKNEDVENFCDAMELRRINADCIQASFVSKRPPSFYPGYDAEEIDDGRLDPIVETGFIRTVEIPDFHQEDETGDLEDSDGEAVVLASEPGSTVRTAPKGPRSNVDYRPQYRAHWGKVRFVGVLRRGRVVPYSTGMLSR